MDDGAATLDPTAPGRVIRVHRTGGRLHGLHLSVHAGMENVFLMGPLGTSTPSNITETTSSRSLSTPDDPSPSQGLPLVPPAPASPPPRHPAPLGVPAFPLPREPCARAPPPTSPLHGASAAPRSPVTTFCSSAIIFSADCDLRSLRCVE